MAKQYPTIATAFAKLKDGSYATPYPCEDMNDVDWIIDVMRDGPNVAYWYIEWHDQEHRDG